MKSVKIKVPCDGCILLPICIQRYRTQIKINYEELNDSDELKEEIRNAAYTFREAYPCELILEHVQYTGYCDDIFTNFNNWWIENYEK